ncbi:MAG: hypothetical protein ACT4NL_06000 [Pseudomarimonas sp.]
MADPNRISLRYTSAWDYLTLLRHFQRALEVFTPLGFVGRDSQVGGRIEFRSAWADFLRQFRTQFVCTDDEFEGWLAGRVPETWKRWKELRERCGPLYSRDNFRPVPGLPEWPQTRDMPVAELCRELRRCMDVNSARIADLGLAEYLKLRVAREGRGLWTPRADGSYLPFEPWVVGSSIHQEQTLWQAAQTRGCAEFIFEQPQLLKIELHALPDATANALQTSGHAITSACQKAEGYEFGGAWYTSSDVASITVETNEVDHMAAVAFAAFKGLRDAMRAVVTRRYGSLGARESVEEWKS